MSKMKSGNETSDQMLIREGRIKPKLSALYCDMYEHRSKGDEESFTKVGNLARELLSVFRETESKTLRNPEWNNNVMTAGYHCAKGDYLMALEAELKGWDHALTIEQKWISALNISDESRRSGAAGEALKWARTAFELNSNSPFSYLLLGQAFYAAGLHDEANEILTQVVELADFHNQKDALASRLMFEREFDEMNIPAAELLRSKLSA